MNGYITDTRRHPRFRYADDVPRSVQTGVIVLTNLWPNAISASLAQTLLDAVIDDWDEMPSVRSSVKHEISDIG